MSETIRRREEAIPHLLDAIAWADAHPDEANETEPPYMLHLFALYLLAEFREARACPLIARLARNPQFDLLTGDAITEDLGRILASVCVGDTALIQGLTEDAAVEELVRGAAVAAFGVLLHTGGKTRAEISGYLGELFTSRLERQPGYVWDSVISLCTDFGFTEHLPAIRECYRAGLADPMFDSLANIEREIVLPPDAPQRRPWNDYTLIDDASLILAEWYSFEPDDSDDLDDLENELLAEELDDEYGAAPGIPIVRETPKIGRNDQCPCGSGKKYKKCCGKAGGG